MPCHMVHTFRQPVPLACCIKMFRNCNEICNVLITRYTSHRCLFVDSLPQFRHLSKYVFSRKERLFSTSEEYTRRHIQIGAAYRTACAVQVVRNASQGVVLFSDSLTLPSWTKDMWAQWFAWEAARWLKSCAFIRPLHHARYLLHERKALAKVVQGFTTPLKVPATRMPALEKIYGAAYVAGAFH